MNLEIIWTLLPRRSLILKVIYGRQTFTLVRPELNSDTDNFQIDMTVSKDVKADLLHRQRRVCYHQQLTKIKRYQRIICYQFFSTLATPFAEILRFVT